MFKSWIRNHIAATQDKKIAKLSVDITLSDYKSTIQDLERYDRGEFALPKNLAKPSALREYMQFAE